MNDTNIYVLVLEETKYYIGKTNDVIKRYYSWNLTATSLAS